MNVKVFVSLLAILCALPVAFSATEHYVKTVLIDDSFNNGLSGNWKNYSCEFDVKDQVLYVNDSAEWLVFGAGLAGLATLDNLYYDLPVLPAAHTKYTISSKIFPKVTCATFGCFKYPIFIADYADIVSGVCSNQISDHYFAWRQLTSPSITGSRFFDYTGYGTISHNFESPNITDRWHTYKVVFNTTNYFATIDNDTYSYSGQFDNALSFPMVLGFGVGSGTGFGTYAFFDDISFTSEFNCTENWVNYGAVGDCNPDYTRTVTFDWLDENQCGTTSDMPPNNGMTLDVCSIDCGAVCSADADCIQTESTCLGPKLGTRSPTGQCSGCICQETPFSYQCIKDQCGAACASDSDCDDSNPGTIDTCADDCSCTHTSMTACGNNVIDLGEQCELPGTLGNSYCAESASTCDGRRYGTRSAFGDCNSTCGCSLQPFAYSCQLGQCGARCASAQDCPETTEKCVGSKLATRAPFGECQSNCTCQKTAFSEPACVKGSCAASCSADTDCSQSTKVCKGGKLGLRSEFAKCNIYCQCRETLPTSYACTKGECGGQCTVDTDCSQFTEVCKSNKVGFRSAFGKCTATCECRETLPTSYACVKGKCGAQCAVNSDCAKNERCTGCLCVKRM